MEVDPFKVKFTYYNFQYHIRVDGEYVMALSERSGREAKLIVDQCKRERKYLDIDVNKSSVLILEKYLDSLSEGQRLGKKIKKYTQDLKGLEKELKNKQNDFSDTDAKHKKLKTEVDELVAKKSKLKAETDSLEQVLSVRGEELAKINASVEIIERMKFALGEISVGELRKSILAKSKKTYQKWNGDVKKISIKIEVNSLEHKFQFSVSAFGYLTELLRSKKNHEMLKVYLPNDDCEPAKINNPRMVSHLFEFDAKAQPVKYDAGVQLIEAELVVPKVIDP